MHLGAMKGRTSIEDALREYADMASMPEPEEDEDGALPQRIVPGSGEPPAQVEVPYCPSFIWVRRGLIEFDFFMRLGHMMIFGIVLAARYGEIMKLPDESPNCSNLNDFFANP